jgi:hypothetical protein
LSQIPFSTLVTALAGMATSLRPQRCPSPKQHVGHPVVVRIDLAAMTREEVLAMRGAHAIDEPPADTPPRGAA